MTSNKNTERNTEKEQNTFARSADVCKVAPSKPQKKSQRNPSCHVYQNKNKVDCLLFNTSKGLQKSQAVLVFPPQETFQNFSDFLTLILTKRKASGTTGGGYGFSFPLAMSFLGFDPVCHFRSTLRQPTWMVRPT